VGNHTTQTLLVHFGTVHAVKEANLEQLESVVNKRAAAIVYKYFHG
jgi:excinuclease UvrABC nuclease subunit